MNPLVTPAWLAARLDDPATVILDATLPPVGVTPTMDTRARYIAGHIPGAIFFDIEEHSDHATSLPHMLPDAATFSRSMSELGIGDRMSIVTYEQENVFSAARAWWMFRTFGAKEVFVLDGGFRAWVEAGLPAQSGEVQRAPATFHAVLNRDAVKSLAEVGKIIAGTSVFSGEKPAQLSASVLSVGQILDARSAARFAGVAPEPRAGLRSGHMPGAISVPFTEVAEANRLKPPEQLRELFAAKGVDLQRPITTTCGSGVTAAVITLALEMAGASEVSLYDGSWAEYGREPDAAIEVG